MFTWRERSDHTLQTTALVNEAYLRLMDWKNVRWQDRVHFVGVAARLMRYILVNYAKRKPFHRVSVQHGSLDNIPEASERRSADLVAIDGALNALARFDPCKGQIVEMRFLGGLSNEEIAEVLDVGPITVIREWNKAKAWLYEELSAKRT